MAEPYNLSFLPCRTCTCSQQEKMPWYFCFVVLLFTSGSSVLENFPARPPSCNAYFSGTCNRHQQNHWATFGLYDFISNSSCTDTCFWANFRFSSPFHIRSASDLSSKFEVRIYRHFGTLDPQRLCCGSFFCAATPRFHISDWTIGTLMNMSDWWFGLRKSQ